MLKPSTSESRRRPKRNVLRKRSWSTSVREEKRKKTKSLKLSVSLPKRRLRFRDYVNSRKELPIDKLISMLSEPSVPLKKLSATRELVRPEKLPTAPKS